MHMSKYVLKVFSYLTLFPSARSTRCIWDELSSFAKVFKLHIHDYQKVWDFDIMRIAHHLTKSRMSRFTTGELHTSSPQLPLPILPQAPDMIRDIAIKGG